MRRRRAFNRRSGKRSVSWVDGFSTTDDAAGTNVRTVSLTGPIPGTAHTWSAVSELVGAADLTFHGGEDAVLSRIRGTLIFGTARVNSGAGFAAKSFPLQLVCAQHAKQGGAAFNEEFLTTSGLGRDDILWTGATWATSDTHAGASTWDFDQPWRIEVDVKAKRRVQVDHTIAFYFQTVLPGGTTAADFEVSGFLRTLLMRPR